MVPQGSTLLNTEYFDNLIETANNIQTCAELQLVANEAMASLGAVKEALNDEIAKLAPILALLTAPGVNLGQVVTWITNFIDGVLRPMYEPYITYEAQLILLTAKIAELTAALNDAAARIPHCTIHITPP